MSSCLPITLRLVIFVSCNFSGEHPSPFHMAWVVSLRPEGPQSHFLLTMSKNQFKNSNTKTDTRAQNENDGHLSSSKTLQKNWGGRRAIFNGPLVTNRQVSCLIKIYKAVLCFLSLTSCEKRTFGTKTDLSVSPTFEIWHFLSNFYFNISHCHMQRNVQSDILSLWGAAESVQADRTMKK